MIIITARGVCVIVMFCFLQAIINSTITPNMTFTKTSHKFGQWADSRANTVYGLGFSSEAHLSKVRLILMSLVFLLSRQLYKSVCLLYLCL